MKVKTSITLSEDLMAIIEDKAKQYKSRSDFIEYALRNYIKLLVRNQQSERDGKIINKQVEHLNREAEDVLTYQVFM
jgi:metal-responsive CopG/Arc/MetJ family transcriptional regulator